jgi:Protein of unknown function (DUF3987)
MGAAGCASGRRPRAFGEEKVTVAALVSIGATVGRKVGIRPKQHDDWTVVPNLWGMGVLPPGWLKSYCLEEPKKPLARLEADAR